MKYNITFHITEYDRPYNRIRVESSRVPQIGEMVVLSWEDAPSDFGNRGFEVVNILTSYVFEEPHDEDFYGVHETEYEMIDVYLKER